MKWNRNVRNLISAFRGLPTDNSRLYDRGSKPMGSLIEVLEQRHQIGQNTAQDEIRDQWTRIVGAEFAVKCKPEKIDAKGYLIVRTSNSIVRRELQFREDGMMTAIRSIEACNHIKGIRLIAG